MATAPIFGEIYLHYCPLSQRGYVGQTTKGIGARWELHLRCARSPRTPAYQTAIARAVRKYGVDGFEHQILSVAHSQKQLDNLEKVWIILLQTKAPNGYNLADGGYAAAGHVVTPEVRARLSAAAKKQWQNPETRARCSQIGKKQSPEHIAKRIAKMLGRKASPEEIAKRVAKTTGLKRTNEFRAACAARMMGKKMSEETRLRMSLAQKARQERGITNG